MPFICKSFRSAPVKNAKLSQSGRENHYRLGSGLEFYKRRCQESRPAPPPRLGRRANYEKRRVIPSDKRLLKR